MSRPRMIGPVVVVVIAGSMMRVSARTSWGLLWKDGRATEHKSLKHVTRLRGLFHSQKRDVQANTSSLTREGVCSGM
jgi:hypothetical protein